MQDDDPIASGIRTADDLLAQEPPPVLPHGVERAQMLAALDARMFGSAAVVRIGRFELGPRLGAGAMGVVYEARDPELDRRVALKVLRGADLDTSSVERLVVEARALAKLRHPNVVTVYEVGRDGDDQFIVMDLVQGETLRSWLKTPRPWREVVRMFIGAGQGLQAAHEAGLVHRDFKPDNVLVEEGQPKVVDFGLAAGVDEPLTTTLRDPSDELVELGRFTQTGGFVGTPVYMASEQYGGKATPASDQYAFCVSLFEALEGRRPYAHAESTGLEVLRTAREVPVPTGLPRAAPRWLRRALARGLADRSSERWPSMLSLLEVLRRVDGTGRRRATAFLGVLGIAVVAGGIGSRWHDNAADGCSDAAAALRGSWSEDRQADLEQAFAATGLPYAADTWSRAAPVLDAYAQEWASAAQRACAADLAAPNPAPPLNEARRRCLERRRFDFESLLETFELADSSIIDRAIDAATSIPSVADCNEGVLVREQVERGRARSTGSPELYERVAAADVAFRTGDDATALRSAQEVLRRAREVGDQELATLAALVSAQTHERAGALEAALDSATDAVAAAEALGDSRLRAKAQIRLLSVLSEQRAFDPSTRLARFVRASLVRLGDPPALLLDLSLLEGWLLLYQGELEPALRHFEQTQALLDAQPNASSRQSGRILLGKGSALAELGRYDEAATHNRRAVELLAERLGAATPRVITARMDLATALSNLGQVKEGITEAKRAVEDADVVAGKDSVLAARARATLAIAYATDGALPEAETLLRTAASTLEDKYGAKNLDAASGWMNLARVLAYNGKPAEAVDVLEHAQGIMSAALPADHADFIYIYTNLAEAHLQLEAWEAALAAARSAEAIALKHFSDDNGRLAEIRSQLGTALRGVGDLSGSEQVLAATLADLNAADGRPGLAGVVQYELALTVAKTGNIEQATTHMRAARTAFESDGDHGIRLKEIDAWLAAHR